MRQLVLYGWLDMRCLTFAAPKQRELTFEDRTFTIRDARTDILRELRLTELCRLRNWCDAVISEQEGL